MKQFLTSSDLKNTAKEHLAEKYGSAALLTFLLSAVSFFFTSMIPLGISMTLGIFTENVATVMSGILLYLVSGFFTIACGVLKSGTSLFYLNIACGQRYSVSDLFYCFGNDFGKCFKLSAATLLPQLIFMFPYSIFYNLFESSYDPKWGGLMLASAVIGTALYLPITLGMEMSFFLMLDFPQFGAGEVLRRSFQIMNGHKGRLFFLTLSFVPLFILCLLTGGIGLLWLTPYMNMTFALFYLDLMKA